MSKHAVFASIGLLIFFLLAIAPKHMFKDISPVIYFLNILLLLLLNFLQWINLIDKPARWIELGGMTFQPSEFMKITLILMLAWIFSQDRLSPFQMYVYALIVTILPAILILMQPDMGTAIMLLAIFIFMLFLSHLGPLYVFLTGGLGILSLLPLKSFFLYDYQIKRLTTFLNPALDPMGEGWSINQALIAVGSGGLKGKGFLEGTQSKMGFLPDTQYSDFIYAVIAEEGGFLGGLSIILLFIAFFACCFSILFKISDYYLKLVLWGFISYWFVQLVVNIGMNIGLMPVTGVPLPFISYGGTAFFANMMAAGIIYNTHLHQQKVSY